MNKNKETKVGRKMNKNREPKVGKKELKKVNMETLMLTDVSEIEYNDFIVDVYPQDDEIIYYYDPYHVKEIEDLLKSDPATMTDLDFVKKYLGHIRDGCLDVEFQQHDRMILTYLYKNKDIVKSFSEDRFEGLRDRVVDRYNVNPVAFMAQYYRSNENNQKMTNLFKDYVRELEYFMNPGVFNFSPMTITTHEKDSHLNKMILDKYHYDISQKGIDAIAVSKKGHVFCIEAKFVGQPGGHQNNQVSAAIQLAKQSNGNISGLAVVDGYPAYNTSEFGIIKENYTDIMGRIITSYDLYKFLEEN